MLVIISSHTRHLPHISLLQTIPASALNRASGLQRPRCNFEYSWQCSISSQGRVLWYLHQSRRRVVAV